jgi:two-component system, NtrC family, nitrogen regulation sensor histidine kinase NtrY
MDFRRLGPRRFALTVGIRASLVGLLVSGAVYLLETTRLYASASILLLAALLIILSLVRIAREMDFRTAVELERLALADSREVQRATSTDLAGSEASLRRAAAKLHAARAAREQRLEYLQALLDTAVAALLVVKPDGRVILANRAAMSLANILVDKLHEIAAVGHVGAQHLLALEPGARQVMSLADGRRVFVAISELIMPGQQPLRLISLQRIVGDLDAVELNAWQDVVDVLAHEIMNSLTPIASLSESLEYLVGEAIGGGMMGNPEMGSELASALHAIRRRSLGLMDFVERYRMVAEIPAVKEKPLLVSQVLLGIEQLMRETFNERRVVWRKTIIPENLVISADPQLLEQAIINLLRNSVDAVGDTPIPNIEICCRVRDEHALIEICDNGCGIPVGVRDRIFRPFFTTKPGGSGIGLNLTRQIALRHGGRLEARTNCPQGSIFSIVLPLSKSVTRAADPQRCADAEETLMDQGVELNARRGFYIG